MAIISRKARVELVLAVADRYRTSTKSDKTLISGGYADSMYIRNSPSGEYFGLS